MFSLSYFTIVLTKDIVQIPLSQLDKIIQTDLQYLADILALDGCLVRQVKPVSCIKSQSLPRQSLNCPPPTAWPCPSCRTRPRTVYSTSNFLSSTYLTAQLDKVSPGTAFISPAWSLAVWLRSMT